MFASAVIQWFSLLCRIFRIFNITWSQWVLCVIFFQHYVSFTFCASLIVHWPWTWVRAVAFEFTLLANWITLCIHVVTYLYCYSMCQISYTEIQTMPVSVKCYRHVTWWILYSISEKLWRLCVSSLGSHFSLLWSQVLPGIKTGMVIPVFMHSRWWFAYRFVTFL